MKTDRRQRVWAWKKACCGCQNKWTIDAGFGFVQDNVIVPARLLATLLESGICNWRWMWMWRWWSWSCSLVASGGASWVLGFRTRMYVPT